MDLYENTNHARGKNATRDRFSRRYIRREQADVYHVKLFRPALPVFQTRERERERERVRV